MIPDEIDPEAQKLLDELASQVDELPSSLVREFEGVNIGPPSPQVEVTEESSSGTDLLDLLTQIRDLLERLPQEIVGELRSDAS